MVLNVNSETFVVLVAIWEQEEIQIYFKKQIQIKVQSGAQVGALLFDKTFAEILAEYSDYSNVFLVENIVEILENTEINDYTITLKKCKQPFFRFIYSLG